MFRHIYYLALIPMCDSDFQHFTLLYTVWNYLIPLIYTLWFLNDVS